MRPATALGLRLRLLAEGPGHVGGHGRPRRDGRRLHRPETVRRFAAGCDVITFDHEHVPTDLLHELEDAGIAVRPGPDALVHAQDKAVMRDRLECAGRSLSDLPGGARTRRR